MDKYYTPEDVSEILLVGSQTVKTWMKQGKLKASKFGPRLWRISESDLQSFIEAAKIIEHTPIPTKPPKNTKLKEKTKTKGKK